MSRKTQAQFECAQCGFEANADVVGAINVLRAGHARFACQVSGAIRPRQQQEPTEATQARLHAKPERRRNLQHSCGEDVNDTPLARKLDDGGVDEPVRGMREAEMVSHHATDGDFKTVDRLDGRGA